MTQQADLNKRRLTRHEALDLLSRPLAGVFSSLSEGGWIHSVPVHFLYTEGQVRFLAGGQDVKTRNVERMGQGTLCVEVSEGNTRSYVSVSGPVTVHRPPEPPICMRSTRSTPVRTSPRAGTMSLWRRRW